MTERDDLEELFAAARRSEPRPDAALMGRIAADAARLSPVGPWQRMFRVIGGWPAAAGFVAATLAGIWIGTVQPAPVDAFIGGEGYEMTDLMPGFGAEWEDAG